MLELIQFPASPFCIVQRRILEFSGAKFKVTNIPNADRSLVWKLTRGRYYQVPVLRDAGKVIFETDDDSQVLAKYLDEKLGLGLFPREWMGVQDLIWRYFENEIEALTFKLHDIHWEEHIPAKHRLLFVRHKERKFGRGCLEKWAAQQEEMLKELERKLFFAEEMLMTRPFLLDARRPLFVDFDLFGMLGVHLHTGHYSLPVAHEKLCQWHQRMAKIKLNRSAREKVYS